MARNPYIKKAHQEIEFSRNQIQELLKCKDDPVYFIENYVKIIHPTKGAVKFKLYDYQKKLIINFYNNKDNIVLAARQTGKSSCASAYILWFASFQFDKTILIASNKAAGAKEMIARIRYAYEHLPYWLKPGVEDDGWNKHSVGFDNGSRIYSTATSEDSGRGLSISLLYLDEFAFVRPTIAEEFWTAITPTLATGGDCIITSTPNGDMNLFATTWRGADLKLNGFKAIEVRWDEPPGRGETFKEAQIAKIGQRKWNQEYECQFLSSDALLIDSIILINETKRIEKVTPINTLHGVIFWDEILPDKTYLVGVDPSTGIGEDFSAITVFSFPELVQVAEFRTNSMSPPKVYIALKNIINYIETKGSEVYFSIENNGVGEGMISLYENDESAPPDAMFICEKGKKRKGMTTTNKSKMKACVNFKELFETQKMTINSLTVLKELKSFARLRGSYAAQLGATDDSVCAILVVVRILEEISIYEDEAFDSLYTVSEDDWFGTGSSGDQIEEPLGIVV